MKEAKYLKKEIKVLVDTLSLYDLEGKVEDVVKILSDIGKWHKEKYPFSAFNNINIHRYELELVGIPYSDGEEYSVNGYRWETDEEYNKRLEINKKAKLSAKKAAKTREENKKAEEFKLYQELQKKYGK